MNISMNVSISFTRQAGSPRHRRTLTISPLHEGGHLNGLRNSRGRQLRVLHVVPALFGTDGAFGGAERYAVELTRALSRRGDVAVRLIGYGDRAAEMTVAGTPAKTVRGWRVRGQDFNRLGPGVIPHAWWADVIHCHQHHIVSSSLLALLGRASGRPVVATDHGGGGFDFSHYIDTERWFAAHLHVSEFSRSLGAAHVASRSTVVFGGVDIDRFQPAPWLTARHRAVFVGRVLPHKGVDDLIRALPTGVGLDIVGPLADKRYASDLRHLADGRDVAIHGPVSEAQLRSRYRNSLCVVLPSVRRDCYGQVTEVPELLGQTLLEGMASGLPAVCTSAGAMPEVVVNGVTGLVVDENDPAALGYALSELHSDQRRATMLGRQGRHRVVEHFSWEAVAERCMQAYHSLLWQSRAR
jgi:glycosyltransferase involved in cell wall biosynthesis